MADTPHLRKFGIFALDLRSREILKSGRRLKLQDQPFLVLDALLEHPGEVVTRDELRRIVWPANTFVDFNNGLNIAVGKLRQVLHDDAAKPRFIETLPRLGYRFIAGVEGTQPATEAVAAPSPVPLRPDRLALGLILTGLLAWLALWTSFGSPRPPSGSIEVRPAVAVMVHDATRQPASARGEQVAERLRKQFADSEAVRAIPDEDVAHAARDLDLADADSFSPKVLGRIRAHTGADFVVVVSLAPGARAGSVSLGLRLQDARKGKTLAARSDSGTLDDLPALAALEGDSILASLGFASQAAAHHARDGASEALPSDSDSAALYVRGRRKLDDFDLQGARGLLEEAIRKDPGFAPAHALLAQVWDAQGYADNARTEAAKARKLSAPNEGILFEPGYQEAMGEWDKAIESYAALVHAIPEIPGYWLRMARAQIKAGKFEGALKTLQGLRRQSPDAAGAAIDYVQSLAQEKMGAFDEAQGTAAAAEHAAQARRQLVLMADARALQCRLFVERSFPDSAASACRSAIETYNGVGDRNGSATSEGYLAWVLFNQGDAAQAASLYREALRIHREIGNQAGAILELNGLANVLRRRGDFTGARQSAEEALRIARLIRSLPDEANALEDTGVAWMREGNLATAQDMFRKALGKFQNLHDQAGVGSVLNDLGETLYLRGNLPEANKMLRQALDIDQAIDYPQDRADVLAWLGRVSQARGQFAEAERQFDQSVAVSSGAGVEVFAAECRLARAESWLGTERAPEAERGIRQAADFFKIKNVPALELEARTMLARALLEEGKPAEAGPELDRAAALHPENYGPEARYAFEIERARVDAAAAALEKTITEANKSHYLVYRLQAQLALGEVAWKRGRTADARRILDKLAKEAHADGFEAIAGQAAAESQRQH
jgi:tetratricopeptide (TPR) repeat protein/DNA-binding winged helix-turn-helix (wHTH) protein